MTASDLPETLEPLQSCHSQSQKRTSPSRVSAIISLLFAAGHFMGGLKEWSPMVDNPVLQSMRTVRFHIMGMDRSYLDFFMGFGHSVTVSLLLQSVLLWVLGVVARRVSQQLQSTSCSLLSDPTSGVLTRALLGRV